MSIGAGIATALLRGLGWFLFALAAVILLLNIASLAGWRAQPVAPSDWLGAVVCAALGAASRWLALRYQRLT